MTTIVFCENVTVCLVSTMLRVYNTIDCTIYYYGVVGPILYGDTRGIRLGPHNGNTLKILERLRECSISIKK